MAINDVYKVRVVCNTAVSTSQIGVNVRYFLTTAEAGISQTPLQIAQFFDGIMAPLYKAYLVDTAGYRGVGVQKIRPSPPAVETSTSANTGPGLIANPPVPTQVAGLITWQTGFAGPAQRGRTYLPFSSVQSVTSAGQWTAAQVTRFQAIATAWQTTRVIAAGGNSITLVAVLWHRATATTTQITNNRVLAFTATQRRRGDYGRTNFLPF